MGRTYREAVTQIPHVRPADPGDFDAILEVKDQVAVDLLSRGVHWNPNVLTADDLSDWAEDKALFAIEISSSVVGCVAVWLQDPDEWWPVGDRAGYIRDLMVHPRLRGQEVGSKVLGWAERYLGGLGKHKIRLDCLASNDRLRRYYTDAGFHQFGVDAVGMAYFEKTLV